MTTALSILENLPNNKDQVKTFVRSIKDEDDEKHVHPLQLDVIDRIVELYSNPGELVLTPFMGVGSEVYSPVRWGRKAIGIELKDSYFKQAVKNLSELKIMKNEQKELFHINGEVKSTDFD